MSTPEEKKRIRTAISKRYRAKHAQRLREYRKKYHEKHRDEENLKRKLNRAGIPLSELKRVKPTDSVEVSQQGS